MYYNDNNSILGTPEGVYYRSIDNVMENNHRIQERTFPDYYLQPNYDPRPVSTKCSHLPLIDLRKSENGKKELYNDHYPEVNFYTGTYNAPFSGYKNNVDVETKLRNIEIPLHHGDLQVDYKPNLNGDLYNVSTIVGRNEEQQFPRLFHHLPLSNTKHQNCNDKIGCNTFYNNTRVQLRNL